MFDAVPADEIAFAMAFFVSSAEHRLKGPAEPQTEAARLDFDEAVCFFLSLCSDPSSAGDHDTRLRVLRTPLFRAFLSLWQHYAGDDRRASLCARVIGFCRLMEETQGALVERWMVATPQTPEHIVLHPAVVEALATTALSQCGRIAESLLLADIERLGMSSIVPFPQPALEELGDAAMTHTGSAWPRGSSEMAAMMRLHPWPGTPLGPVASWPQSLRTCIDVALGCSFPMILLWGPELRQFYNDAYRSLMGTKHPGGFGQPTCECWPEVWSFNEPIYVRVFQGETLTLEDQLFRIRPYGFLEDAYFTLCYSPVRNEAGEVAGVLVTIFNTTARVQGNLGDMARGMAPKLTTEAEEGALPG